MSRIFEDFDEEGQASSSQDFNCAKRQKVTYAQRQQDLKDKAFEDFKKGYMKQTEKLKQIRHLSDEEVPQHIKDAEKSTGNFLKEKRQQFRDLTEEITQQIKDDEKANWRNSDLE